jgi:hypothetical protein
MDYQMNDSENIMTDHLETQLLTILGEHTWFMAALDAVSDLGLPQWCIGAGVIRNIVFDYLDGGSTKPIRDVDVRTYKARISNKQYDKCWKSVRIINEKG